MSLITNNSTKFLNIYSAWGHYLCFNDSSSPHLWGRDPPSPQGYGDGWMQDSWHWTDEIDNSLFATSNHSTGKEDSACHKGFHESCTQKRRTTRAVGGTLYSIKRMLWPLVPRQDVISFLEQFHSLARNWNLVLRYMPELYLVSLVRRVVWLGTLSLGTESEGELVVKPFKALLVSPDAKVVHNIRL